METEVKLPRREKTALILRYLRGNLGFFAGAVVLAYLNTICNAVMPQIIRVTVDSVLDVKEPNLPQWVRSLLDLDALRADPLRALWIAAGAVALAAAVRGLCIYGMRINLARGSEGFVKSIRDGLYQHILRLGFDWHTAHATGDIIQRCTSDVEVIRTFVCNQLMEVLRTVFVVVLYAGIMLVMDWRLALVSIAFVPISLLASGLFYGKISARFLVADEAEGELTTCAQENLTGVRVVRAFGRERHELDRFGEKNNHFSNLWVELGKLLSVYWASGAFLTCAQVMAVILAGTAACVNGGMTLGDFLAFVTYNAALAWPVRSLGRVLSDMSKAGVSLDRVGYILKAAEEEDDPAAQPAALSGDIVFDHVTFGYEGQEVLKDVSFTIPWGSTFAILGGTGSGKSTLMHLLDRLYDLKDGQGRITIGGVDIRHIRREDLRRQIGMVLQEPFLFSQTIRENIAAARPSAPEEELRACAGVACVDDAISELAQGYDTIVGERGVTLSGGQKQRVAIARMLLQNAPVMVFDDSLSAVDAETDAKIRAALKARVAEATVILISHRVTTLMQADRILVLDGGRVADIGTHAELIARPGIYREIYDIQMSSDDRALIQEGGGRLMAAFDEQEYTKDFDLNIWKRLLPILARYKAVILAMITINGLTAVIDVAIPLFQQYAIKHFIEADTLDGLPLFALAYLGAILLEAVMVVGFARQAMHVEMFLGRDLRQDLFRHLQTLSLSFYNVTPVGYLITRVMNDTNRIAGNIAWNLTDMAWALLYVVGVFAAMLALNWQLALVVILVVPAIAALTGWFQPRILHWNRKVRKINSKITGAFNEGISGAKTSKTMVIEDQEIGAFRDLTGSMRQSGVRAARLNAVYIPLALFFSSMAVAIVLLRGGYLVVGQVLDIATLSVFLTYAMGIFEPIQQTAANLAEFIALQASIERVTGLLDEKPLITDAPGVVEKYGDAFHPKRENWEPIRGDIEFDDVTFRYPDGGDNVLEHFSLKIPAGTTVAIVGETGAGKSTLVNLACRFFEPTGGRILIDGRDYRERSQLWLHSSIGYVLQSPHLFSGTVRDNIRYGRLDATDAEIEAAARAVSADTVAAKLDKGWDSPVGEGGDRLSTGEKQLISFARAVLADPRIFVLDEATSSIDTQTEQLIQQAIDHLLKDRTSFLIAHRLSTIRKADLILVVRDGRIVEQGTHETLLRARGYYHDLYSKQFAEENAAKILGA